MACQQGLTFRSTAQMALKPGEELLPVVCGSPQPSGRFSSEVRGCGSAPGSRKSSVVCSEEAPLPWRSHWMGDAVTVPWCAVSCAALFVPGDAKTF